LSWAEWSWRIALATRIGNREHRAVNPWWVSLTTMWPRALLQCLFFTLLGRVIGGESTQAYTFIGAVAVSITLFAFGDVGDVPMRDRWAATFYRLRLSRLPVPLVYVLRALPVAGDAAIVVALCVLMVGPVTGQVELTLRLLALLPFYLIMVATSVAAGLATSSIGLFGRVGSDVWVANVAMYLIIVASGALIPPGRLPLLDAVGALLPMRHALEAVHLHLAGEPWVGKLLMELAVGGGWLLAAVGVYSLAVWRIRRTDHDKVM
jgi:ABC-2 type transport system permease protein